MCVLWDGGNEQPGQCPPAWIFVVSQRCTNVRFVIDRENPWPLLELGISVGCRDIYIYRSLLQKVLEARTDPVETNNPGTPSRGPVLSGEAADSRSGQEMCKLSLESLDILRHREAAKAFCGCVQGLGNPLNRPSWLRVGQFQH